MCVGLFSIEAYFLLSYSTSHCTSCRVGVFSAGGFCVLLCHYIRSPSVLEDVIFFGSDRSPRSHYLCPSIRYKVLSLLLSGLNL